MCTIPTDHTTPCYTAACSIATAYHTTAHHTAYIIPYHTIVQNTALHTLEQHTAYNIAYFSTAYSIAYSIQHPHVLTFPPAYFLVTLHDCNCHPTLALVTSASMLCSILAY